MSWWPRRARRTSAGAWPPTGSRCASPGFFFSSRRPHTRSLRDWSSDVCSSDLADLGFRAYKMRPALGPDRDLETVRLMRKAVGPDFDLMVDAHTWWRMGDRSYDFATVERLARSEERRVGNEWRCWWAWVALSEG